MTLQEVLTALRNADAAGDTQAAQRLAQIAQSMQRGSEFDQREEELKQRLAALKAQKITPETTFGGNVKEAFKGVVPGAIGLAETAGTGLAALLPEEAEKSTRGAIKSVAEAAKKPFEAAPGYEDSVGRKLGEGLGSTLPFFALGPLGAPGAVAGAGLGVAAGAGEAREAAEAKGATGAQRRTATLLGAPTGLLDILAPEIKPFKGLITTALARGGVEGATEAAQKVAQNLIAKGVYDPKQGVLEGSGEEGAYGAGIGALASLILDMTIGRKAHTRTTEPPKGEEPKKPQPLQLGYDQKPFTPVVAPDGSVITSQAELDALNAKKQSTESQRAEDRRTSDPMASVPADQREMARRSKEAALAETFAGELPEGQMAIPGVEREGGVEVPGRGRVADEQVTEQPVEESTPVRDTQTRDMIDELEEAQIRELEAEDTSAKLRGELAAQKAEELKAKQKLDSDIAELDGQLARKQEKTTEDRRLTLLLPIIESGARNIPKMFVRALKREGITDLNLTERERNLINRAYDLRMAEAPVAQAPEVVPSAPAENQGMEARIPEKGAKPGPQGQLSIEGLGAPTGEEKSRLEVQQIRREQQNPQAFSQEELEAQQSRFPTVLTAEVLDATGLPKNSGVYKQLLDVDMADQANWPHMGEVLARVRGNKFLPNATKDAIERIAGTAFGAMAKQQDLFPTKLKTALRAAKGAKSAEKPAVAQTPATTSPDNAGVGASPSGSKPSAGKPRAERPAANDTEQAKAPKPTGLGANQQPVRDTAKREGEQPTALKAEKKASTAEKPAEAKAEKPTAPKESKPKADDAINAYSALRDMDEADLAIRTLAADAYLAMVDNQSAAALSTMAADISAGKLPELKFGRTNTNGPGSNGRYAKEFYESLSAKEKDQFAKDLQDFFYSEIRTKKFMDAFNASQYLARDIESGKVSLLLKESDGLVHALHPEVVTRLKANNLPGALQFIAQQGLGRVSQIAAKLAARLGGDIEVVMADFQSDKLAGPAQSFLAKHPDAKGTSGAYVTTTGGKKYLFLNTQSGMDVWTLLHESTHPLVDATLDNPAHPMTKQLQQLFDDVKGSLDTAYGATSLKEFVAEAWSNPTFQQKLASINPKGEKITALQRFVHAVRNFLRQMVGLDTKGMGSAMDSADLMIEALINGHPGTSASLQTVSLLKKGGEYLNAMGAYAESLPGMNQERVAGIHEMLTGAIPGKIKNIVRQSLPLNALAEVAKKYIPMAPQLDVLVGQRGGAENRRNQAIEPIVDKAAAWAKANPEKMTAFNGVVYESTLAQVDPSKPRSEYVGQTDSSGNKKDAAWDAMQEQWKALGPEGQTIYKLMRDTYKKMYEDVRNVLDGRIDGAVEDIDTRKKLKTEIYKRLFESGHIEPYFPLTRSGSHWLSYTHDGEFYVEAFETAYQRDAAIKELQTEGATEIQKFANLNQVNYRKAPATSFVNNILRTLEANKVDNNVTEEVMRLFLNTLPETSFAQSFRRRKGTLGFQKDAIGALRTKTFSLSRQLSNMEYGAKLEKLRAEMKDYVRTQGNQEAAVDMMNELDARIDYAISPNVPQWSKLATSLGFNMTLGFNVSSALVNLAQIPLVVMPYLGGKYGYSDTARALGRATRYFTGSGFDREVEMLVATDKGEKKVKVKAFPSLDNYDFKSKDAPKHLETLSKVAGERGQLNRSQTYDVLDVDDSQSVLTKINAASGFVFHHGERMNRQVAMIAAYELELQRLVGKGKELASASEAQRQKAAEYAIEVTELTNGGTAAAAAPRIAQSALGKVLFMYKRYGVSMYYMLFKTTRDMFARWQPDPEVRSAAKRQIAGIYASAALMAGAQGVPMFGVAAMLYNLFLKGDDDDDFDTAARKWMGEGAYSGAINALTGRQISSRISLSDLLFRDANTKPSDSMIWSFAEMMGGPVIGVASRVERGLKLIGEGHTERGIEQMLPSAIGNVMKAIRFGTEGANTLRGDPITGEIGPWNSFAQAFGFAPAEYTRQLEINSSLKNIERKTMEERTQLLRKYYVAYRNGDAREAADIVQDMIKFSRRHPGAAITPEAVQRSMDQHMKTTQEMYHGITLNKSLRGELLQNAAEFDGE